MSDAPNVTGGRELKIEVDLVSEQVIIGAAVAGWDDGTCERLLRIFGPDHFVSIEHGVIWQTFREMKARKLGFDLATARAISGGQFNNSLVDLVSLIADARPEVPENLDYHVGCVLWDRSKRTALQGPIASLLEELQDPKADQERIFSLARQIPNALQSGDRKHLYETGNLVRQVMAQIESMSGGVRYPFGIDGLDYFESVDAARSAGIVEPERLADKKGRVRRMLPGSEPGYITLVSGMSGGGKALDITTPIATTDGWTTMKDIQVGDKVFDELGLPCTVLSRSDVMLDHQCFRVDFSESPFHQYFSIIADADHQWFTRDESDRSNGRDGSVRTTLQVAESLQSRHVVASTHPFNHTRSIRTVAAVEKVKSVPVRCITVDSPSHLFLAGRAMIPTHNSTLATAITLAIALRKRKILYCAWEPKAEMVLQALACARLGWSRQRVLQGMITAEEKAILREKMNAIGQYVKFMGKGAFYDFGAAKKRRTNQENLDVFASYVSDSGCNAVIGDLWKYVLVPQQGAQQANDEEEALKYQQAMCEEQRFHLFLLQQQVHKRMEMRADKRPSREGVKGSGAYLEIVDTFIAPHIPSLWKPGIAADKFELFVLKQRYGRWPLGIEFNWNPDSGAISGGRSIPYDFDTGEVKAPRMASEVKDRGWRGARGNNHKSRPTEASDPSDV